MRGFEAGCDPAHAAIATDEHGLAGLLAATGLRTNVVSRREGELGPIPERCMITGMIVGVAAKDIEDNAAEQLAQSFGRRGEAVTNDFRQILIAGVTRHHLVKREHRQR